MVGEEKSIFWSKSVVLRTFCFLSWKDLQQGNSSQLTPSASVHPPPSASVCFTPSASVGPTPSDRVLVRSNHTLEQSSACMRVRLRLGREKKINLHYELDQYFQNTILLGKVDIVQQSLYLLLLNIDLDYSQDLLTF